MQQATSAPTDENLEAAWEQLKPAVGKLRDYYLYAIDLEQSFPELLKSLCEGGIQLESMQALAKQLGALLDFVIRFDHIKMNTPPIQNDFSYYRRSMQRMKAHNVETAGVLSDEDANRMSLFYASHTPVMAILISSVQSFSQANHSNVSLDSILSALSILAHSTRDMVKQHRFESPSTNVFCLRTMTACVILFDQLDSLGAFHKKSPINIRSCVAVLREWPEEEERVSLANMLRFTTRHLKDDSALPGIADMLNEAAQTSAAEANNNNL